MTLRVLVAGLVLAALIVSPMARAQTAPQPESHYLFSSFRDNGQDGLHLAHSRDGLTWTALKGDRSFLPPTIGTKLMRDPSIVRGPDGVFHLVWTTGWWDQGIGVAHSKDLITWSAQQFVPVMKHEPTAINCWAPDLFYDDATQTFLIVWATTIPGRFPKTEESGDAGGDANAKKLNHRLYYVTTRDFTTYSETKLFYDGGFNAIDGTIVKDGSRYVLIVKDETRRPEAKKDLRIAVAPHAVGPYGPASAPFTPTWVEGPTVLRLPSPHAWTVYYDEYTRHRYGAMQSTDLTTWKDVSPRLSLPPGTRHGTAFAVPADIANGLLALGTR